MMANAAGANSTPSTSSRKKRILVVDDERDITESIKAALKAQYWVDVGNSSQALASYKPRFYDLILLDYRMPNVDGIAFYEHVKSIDPKQKICFMTAYEEFHTRIANLKWRNRVNSLFQEDITLPVLKKPFDTATLMTMISGILGD
jgi:DNA-binding NtrC family response regulator